MDPHLILGVGELLWDMLPEGPRLGGAPANFAVMAGRLGSRAAILSRIGRDEIGHDAIAHLDPMPVDTDFIQVDSAHATGRVTVRFAGGEPHYTIHQPAAWDYMELSPEWMQLARRADAICFGTLAQRNRQSRRTVQNLAAECPASCIRIFDVNLRPPFYSAEVLEESLELATVVKMNAAEARLVLELLDLAEEDERVPADPQLSTIALRNAAGLLLSEFPELQLVAITRGGYGSFLAARHEWNEHPGFPVTVADAIGAGDAFTAALTHYLLHGAGLAMLNEAANRWGAWVASQSGAMPVLPDHVRDAVTADIEKTMS